MARWSPDPVCPHCGAATINAQEKMASGMFGPPCRCRACGGYSREKRLPRLMLSVILYVLPAVALVGLLALAPFLGVRDEQGVVLLVIGLPVYLLWYHWLAYRLEARFARDIPLYPVTPSAGWLRFKEICRWLFLISIPLAFLLNWIAGH